MKIHHLIHALMLIVHEHPEAKDADVVMTSAFYGDPKIIPRPTYYQRTSSTGRPLIILSGEESR